MSAAFGPVGGIGSLDEAQALDPLNILNPGKVLPDARGGFDSQA